MLTTFLSAIIKFITLLIKFYHETQKRQGFLYTITLSPRETPRTRSTPRLT